MRRIGMLVCAIGLTAVSSTAAAQDSSPETGFAISVRTPSGSLGDLFATATGSPVFTLAHRGERYGIGLGAGITLLRSTDRDTFTGGTSEEATRASAFQIGPAGWVDVWHSPDGQTRGNLAGGVSIGRLALTSENTFTPTGGPPQTNESKTSGTILGVRIGVGADHFLHANFAIGVEAGIQNTFLLDVGQDATADFAQDTTFGASGTYGALRVTVVF